MVHLSLLEKGIKCRRFNLFSIEHINTDDIFSVNFCTKSYVNLEVSVNKADRMLIVDCRDNFYTESTIHVKRKTLLFRLPDHIDVEEYFTQKFSNEYYIFFKQIAHPVPHHYFF